MLHKLKPLGYGLLIHDAYRPWYVTKIFWDATPPEGKIFVANPQEGSKHNRGCAVDLTLYDLSTGQPIEMPGLYDEMSPRSFPNFPGGTSRQRWHRDLLRRAMESEGFTVNEDEWWHFDYKDWKQYGILNVPFEKIAAEPLATSHAVSHKLGGELLAKRRNPNRIASLLATPFLCLHNPRSRTRSRFTRGAHPESDGAAGICTFEFRH